MVETHKQSEHDHLGKEFCNLIIWRA